MPTEHGRVLARAGVILFAISLINGFFVHALALQRQALAAHLVGLIGASFLIGLGGLWPHLKQSPQISRTGMLLALYGFFGGWLVNFQAALTRVLGLYPISVAASETTSFGDAFVSAGLLTVALAHFALCGIVFRALRPELASPR